MTLTIRPNMNEDDQLAELSAELKDYSDEELLALWDQSQNAPLQGMLPPSVARSIAMTMEIAVLRELNLRRYAENRPLEVAAEPGVYKNVIAIHD